MSRGELILKIAIVLAVLAWAFWPVAVPPPPAERKVRCEEARDRYRAQPIAWRYDEVVYYCVRAR